MADEERRAEMMSLRAKRMRHLPRGVETTMVAHRAAPADAELERVRARVKAALDRPGSVRRPVVGPATTPRSTTTTSSTAETPELARARRHLERSR